MANSNLIIIKHPLLQHKLGFLRNKNTPSKVFRELVDEMTQLLLYEATADLPQEDLEVECWSGQVKIKKIVPQCYSLVPIMRAGLGMLSAALNFMPNSVVHFLGIFREEDTSNPVVYYDKIKDTQSKIAIILDPMLATGGTISKTIQMLSEKGFEKFKILSLIASGPGVDKILKQSYDTKIYCAAFDPILDSNNFIVPGLGDAGDRIYNT